LLLLLLFQKLKSLPSALLAGTIMETGAMHNAQQSWIRGTVKNVVDNKEFGFIKAHGALPPAFINKDVYFRTHLATWNIRTNDLVEFLLKPELNSRPSAYKIRHIAPDGSVLDSDLSKKRATYVPAKDSAKRNANDFKELHTSSSRNSSTELMRCSSESSIINLALSDGEDHAEESSESVSKPVQLRAPTKMGFLQVRDKMQFGKIVAIKDAFGFIKRTHEEGQGFQRNLYFSLTSCQSGLLSLMPGDEVSFFVREKRDEKQPYAYNIRLVKGIARSSDVIRKYIELLRERIDTGSSQMVEDISMALLCTASLGMHRTLRYGHGRRVHVLHWLTF
jgi:cold shock CspA family protein